MTRSYSINLQFSYLFVSCTPPSPAPLFSSSVVLHEDGNSHCRKKAMLPDDVIDDVRDDVIVLLAKTILCNDMHSFGFI